MQVSRRQELFQQAHFLRLEAVFQKIHGILSL